MELLPQLRGGYAGVMEMPDCENCNEKCPQAEMAHEIALGRMYATQELVKLVKQIDIGQLVEVVRCNDCIGKSTWYNDAEYGCAICGMSGMYPKGEFDFCSYGERKGGDGNG